MVKLVEAKRFSLCFLEGRGLLGGWLVLAEKLRHFGVDSLSVVGVAPLSFNSRTVEDGGSSKDGSKGSFANAVRKAHGRLGEAIWIQVGYVEVQKRKAQLRRCLVGRWSEGFTLNLSSLYNWVDFNWPLKGGVRISQFGEAFLLFDFEVIYDVERVFLRGVRKFKDRVLSLDWWSPEVGCYQKEVHAKEVWVRVVGLPLHLWYRGTLKKIGDSCGGFVTVDEVIASG